MCENVTDFYATVSFVSRFASSALVMESGYFFTSLQIALAFVDSMQASDLTECADELFDSHVIP